MNNGGITAAIFQNIDNYRLTIAMRNNTVQLINDDWTRTGSKDKKQNSVDVRYIETLQTGGPYTDNNRKRFNGDNHRHQESKRRPRLILDFLLVTEMKQN